MWTPLPWVECPICKFVALDRRQGRCWACHATHAPQSPAIGTHVMVLCTDQRIHPAEVVATASGGRLRVRFADGTEDERLPAHLAAGVPHDVEIVTAAPPPASPNAARGGTPSPRSTQMVSQFGSYAVEGVTGGITHLDGAHQLQLPLAPPAPNLDRYLGATFEVARGDLTIWFARPDGKTTKLHAQPGRPAVCSEPIVSTPTGISLTFQATPTAYDVRYTIDFHSGTKR